jgi:hypothetical protein
MELDVRVYSDDGTLKPEHVLHGWGNIFIGCSERAGRSLRTHEKMRKAIEKAGFVDVHEQNYKIPLGPWPKDKLLKEAGHLQYAHWNTALEGWAMWLLTHYGEPEPWTKEEVQVYLARVRAELKNPHIHAYEPAYVLSESPLLGYFKLTDIKDPRVGKKAHRRGGEREPDDHQIGTIAVKPLESSFLVHLII